MMFIVKTILPSLIQENHQSRQSQTFGVASSESESQFQKVKPPAETVRRTDTLGLGRTCDLHLPEDLEKTEFEYDDADVGGQDSTQA